MVNNCHRSQSGKRMQYAQKVSLMLTANIAGSRNVLYNAHELVAGAGFTVRIPTFAEDSTL